MAILFTKCLDLFRSRRRRIIVVEEKSEKTIQNYSKFGQNCWDSCASGSSSSVDNNYYCYCNFPAKNKNIMLTSSRSEDEISLVSSSMSNVVDGDKQNCSCLPLFTNSPRSAKFSPSSILRSSRSNRPPTEFADSRITSHVIPTSLTDPEISDRKVAMDFTLPKSKIVSDPNEMINVLREEQMRTKEKMRLHSPDTRVPQISCYLVQPWFHQGLTREITNEMLREHNYKEGTFLIRLSNRLPGCFVLSLAHNNAVLHYPITSLRGDDGEYLLTLDSGRTKFRDLIQLVNFYEVNSGGILPTLLQNHIAQSISLRHHTNVTLSPSSL